MVEKNTIRIVICIPHIRSINAVVRKEQKIRIILKAFPNIQKEDDLIFWFEGAQLLLDLTFEEVGIHDNSMIVIGVKSDDILMNQYWVRISANSKDPKIISHLLNTYDGISNEKHMLGKKKSNDNNFEKKYLFIQKLKSLYCNFNFINIKTDEKKNLNVSPLLSKPFPIIG